MSPITVVERKRLRAEQRRRHGYSDAATLTNSSSVPAPPPPVVEIPEGFVSKKAFPSNPPAKRKKSSALSLVAFVQDGTVDPPSDPSWRKHLKVVTTATAEGPIKTAWDSMYPINRVLNGVLPHDDQEKAATMGFGPTMVAIKTYGLWSSFMAHLLESSFRKSVEEVSRLAENLKQVEAKIADLQVDVQKFDSNKSMLEGKLAKIAREAKESAAKIMPLKGDLRLAKEKLEAAEAKLKEAEAAVVPESERYQLLQVANEE